MNFEGHHSDSIVNLIVARNLFVYKSSGPKIMQLTLLVKWVTVFLK